jgi:hypothetical protein
MPHIFFARLAAVIFAVKTLLLEVASGFRFAVHIMKFSDSVQTRQMSLPNTCTFFLLSYLFHRYFHMVLWPFNKHSTNPVGSAWRFFAVYGDREWWRMFMTGGVGVTGRKRNWFGRWWPQCADHVLMLMRHLLFCVSFAWLRLLNTRELLTRHVMYVGPINATLRRVCINIVAVEKQEVLYILSVCVCGLCYSARKAHALCYIVIYDLSGCTTFFYIISQTARLRWKKLLNIKCVFRFSLQMLSETFHILRRIRRDIIINAHWYGVKYALFL